MFVRSKLEIEFESNESTHNMTRGEREVGNRSPIIVY